MATYIIDGRLTRDAEMKSTKDGRQFAKFTVAWNRGEKKDAHFYSCTLGGDKAVRLLPYLRQGKYVIVTGEPDWNEYEGKVYETIRADKVTFAGNASEPSKNPECKPYQYDGKYFDNREQLEEYKKANPSTEQVPFDDCDIPF